MILITIAILILVYVIYRLAINNLIYVKSDIDNKIYQVQDLPDKKRASNILATINRNKDRLISILKSNKNNEYSEYTQYIDQLIKNSKNVVIRENVANSFYTSYSVNKGEELVFCLRSKSRVNELHDINLLMYVVLHELAHIACPEYGHTELFKKIFAFFIRVAIKNNMYTLIDFDRRPVEYCGMSISESIVRS